MDPVGRRWRTTEVVDSGRNSGHGEASVDGNEGGGENGGETGGETGGGGGGEGDSTSDESGNDFNAMQNLWTSLGESIASIGYLVNSGRILVQSPLTVAALSGISACFLAVMWGIPLLKKSKSLSLIRKTCH